MKQFFLSITLFIFIAGCSTLQTDPDDPRDQTKRGATIGAIVGAVAGVFIGDGEADEILAGAAIGAGLGAGIGAYMDRQQAALEEIESVEVERLDEETLRIHFDSDILFAVDSAVLSEASHHSLDDFSVVMRDFPKTAIVIMGYTDSQGSEEYNQALSERRANSVSNHLIRSEIDPARMVAIGFGEADPVETNETSAGRARNRRVSILVKGKA
jgi:outer membrane protein OmpA-like peptidoglycan-associated protein